MRSNIPVLRSNLSPVKGVDSNVNFEYLHDIQEISYNKFLIYKKVKKNNTNFIKK